MIKAMPVLYTERLILRPMKEEDAEKMFEYKSIEEVARFQPWESYSMEDAEKFIDQYKNQNSVIPGIWIARGIELKNGGILIGDCALKIHENDTQQAEIGITLSPEFQGGGYASEAVATLLDFAFTDLELHRVIAITDARNINSYNMLERIGFRREAHFIKNIFFKGAWGDEYQYAILEEEWKEKNRE